MATQVPVLTVRVVNTSNAVLEAGGTPGSASQVPTMTLRAISAGGKVIESTGDAGSMDGLSPGIAVRIVNSSNQIIKSDGTASASTATPMTAVRFVGSNGTLYGSGTGGVPMMDVRVVDETSTILSVLFGGSGGASSAGQPIGLLLVLTKAS